MEMSPPKSMSSNKIYQLFVDDTIILKAALPYLDKEHKLDTKIPRPMFTRHISGSEYIQQILNGHPDRAYWMLRMATPAFVGLKNYLVSHNLLQDSRHVTAAEQLGIFLRIISQATTIREGAEFFQHSVETISRYFQIVLKAICSTVDTFIILPTDTAPACEHIKGNPNFYPFFKECIGAIDGTHIPAFVPKDDVHRYYNRKGFTSQNVIAAVNFERQFVYIGTGWEGSAADMRILRCACEKGGLIVPDAARALEVLNFSPLGGKPMRLMYSCG